MINTFIDKIQIFTLNSIAVFLEAAPFLILGALLSALFEMYVPQKVINKLIPQKKSRGIIMGISMGFLLPTCECGVVPIVRKLMQKGFPGYMVISYLLAAPVVNPIVIISTYIAFRYNYAMVIGRLGIVIIVAAMVGWILSHYKESFLLSEHDNTHKCSCGHDYSDHNHDAHENHTHCSNEDKEHIHCSHENHVHHVHAQESDSKLFALLRHISDDFISMGTYLIVGSFAASAFKTFAPGDILTLFQSNLLLSIFIMMVLAILLSICSEADAFVAASFTKFHLLSQLSFVTIGPMVDLKLIAMYCATFKRKVILTIIIFPTVMIFVLSYLLGIIFT